MKFNKIKFMKPAHNTSCFEIDHNHIFSLLEKINHVQKIIMCFDLKVETLPFKGRKKGLKFSFLFLYQNMSLEKKRINEFILFNLAIIDLISQLSLTTYTNPRASYVYDIGNLYELKQKGFCKPIIQYLLIKRIRR